jgi:hypothetical protein
MNWTIGILTFFTGFNTGINLAQLWERFHDSR